MNALTAESFKEYNTARQRAFIEEWLSAFTGRDSHLLSFEEVRRNLNLHDSAYKGLQEIELDKIVGSLGRYRDFTRTFFPKNDNTQERWRRVDAIAHDQGGFPPIEVYQVGEAYFVRDGNHRVSVARIHQAPTIEAYVIEYKTAVSIDKEDDMDAILLKMERATFLEKSQLDKLRPDHDLFFTEPGRYRSVEEHIAFHKYLKEREYNQQIPYEVAVASWYDTVYCPIIALIREQQLLKHFPNRTEADLYAWILLHRAALEEEMAAMGYISAEDVIDELKAEAGINPITRIISYFQHLLHKQKMPLKVERAKFFDETGLNETRPEHNIDFTEPGCYELAKEHIIVHKYLKETDEQIELSAVEAAASWYDLVYQPIINLVRERQVLAYFPGNSEADLYIWLVSRRAALEEKAARLGQVPDENLLEDLAEKGRAAAWTRWIPIFRPKLDLQGLLLDE
jgi:hypothetical protein